MTAASICRLASKTQQAIGLLCLALAILACTFAGSARAQDAPAPAQGAPSPAPGPEMGLLPAPPAAPLELGIADQRLGLFSDPRFTALHMRHARIVVAWNALSFRWARDFLDTWMAAALRAGVSPLITFGNAVGPGRHNRVPSVKRLGSVLVQLRRRYPWFHEVATWNEPNLCGNPLCRRPGLAAAYYRELVRVCKECTVLAGEVVDTAGMTAWVRAFRRAVGVEPAVWGLHNYVDANRLRSSGTQALLRITRGQVWFTETGGLVWRRSRPGKVAFEESPKHAAKAMNWIFTHLVKLSPRVRRVYVYQWNRTAPHDNWDSALIAPNGKARDAYRVVLKVAQRLAGVAVP